MDWLWWLTLGALIGFLAEWIWDWIWFRRREQTVSVDVETQSSALRGERDKLAADLRACGERSKRLESEIAPLHARIGELEPLQAQVGQLSAEIRGLNSRVDDLSAENERLRADLAATDNLHDRIGELSNENVRLRTELVSARASSSAQPGVDTVVTTGLVAEDMAERAIGQTNDDNPPASRDPLVDINGIGSVFEQRLFDAGVYSFAQLSCLSAEEIRAIIKPESWQKIDPEAWIAEARLFAEQMREDTYRKGGA